MQDTTKSKPGGSAKRYKSNAKAPSFGELVSLLGTLLKGNTWFTVTLFGVSLLSSVAEGLGFSLVIPLLQTMLSNDGGATSGPVTAYLQGITGLFPADWQLAGILLLLVALFFVKSAALVVMSGLTRWFSNTLRLQWVTAAFANLMRAPYSQVVHRPHGELVQDIIGETDDAARAVVLLVEFMARLVQIAVLVTLLLLADWRITLAIGAVTVGAFALIWRRTHHLSLDSGVVRQQIRQSTTDTVSESISLLRDIKLLDLVDARTETLRKKLLKHRRIDTIFNIVGNLPTNVIDFAAIVLGTAVILFTTSVLGLKIETVLPMTALFGVVFLRIMSATGYLFSRRMSVTTSIPSLLAVHNRIATPPEQEPGGKPFPGFRGDIEFHNIVLKPQDRDELFTDLTMRIAATGLTAIIGPSGVGKTTLVDLLVGLRKPDAGRITVGGEDISQFDVRTVRARVGYLGQNPQLFNCSIRDNLLMGRPNATTEELHSAARRAHAHDFIVAMPEGYDTLVGRGGAALSGGQRQRLALARELVRNAELYIFDEPTSALDHEAELVIQELMNELSKTGPVVVIAHRLTTISAAKTIYRLEHGKAVQIAFNDLRLEQQAQSFQ